MPIEIPRKNNLQLLNMNMGFLGIQFGWSLQMANMSAIYEHLHAKPDEIPGLWLAAPLTGLLVQPLIGYFSDRTWGRLGRRRPYFLAGAILSTIALVAMPNAMTLRAAALLLWILDACINISMEPFRAFVSDVLPREQRPKGFATQSLLIGLGATIASALPYLLEKLSLSPSASNLPGNITWAFYIGAVAFISAVLWTVCTTGEYPPPEKSDAPSLEEPAPPFPPILLSLAPIQFLTWLGLFCMWQFLPVAVAHHIFQAEQGSALYMKGIAWAGLGISAYSIVTFAFSFALPGLALRLGTGRAHGLCLAIGGLGLLSCSVIRDPYMLFLSMGAVGIAWASILSLPYALLSRQLRANNTGLWMGIFNGCIVIPEILQALTFGWVMKNLLDNNRMSAVCVGGACLMAAAVLSFLLLARNDREEAAAA